MRTALLARLAIGVGALSARLRPAVLFGGGIALIAGWLASAQPAGNEFRINSYTTNDQTLPVVAYGIHGDFVVVWAADTEDGSKRGVFGQRYGSDGAPLGLEFRVNSYTSDVQYAAAVASGPGGDFVVVWNTYARDNSPRSVFAQRYDSTGSPLGSEFRANTYTTGRQWIPWVAMQATGDFVVVWNGNAQDGSSYGVFGQRYASAGYPVGDEFRSNTYTTDGQFYPVVAAAPDGNFVIAWNSNAQDGSYYGVFAQRYASNGSLLGGEFRVNTYTTGSQSSPAVAVGTDGDFLVVWQSADGSFDGIFGQRYASSGTPLGFEFRVNSYTPYSQARPGIAAGANGDFAVVWQGFGEDGSDFGIFGQRYTSTGSPLGEEFQVSMFTTGAQRFPALAGGPGGSFVVVWQSKAQDGSSYGIFGQRYCFAGVTVTPPVPATVTQTLCQ